MVHLIHSDGAGGGPHSLARQIEHFRLTYAITLIHGGCGQAARLCDSHGIPRLQLPLDRAWKLPLGFPRLILALARLKPDILVLHGQWAAPLGALAGRLVGVKRIVYVARWPAFYTSWDLFRSIRNDLSDRLPCRLADRIVTLSASTRYRYLYHRMAPGSKITVIPNPVESDVIPAPGDIRAIRERHGWDDATCHIVSVGRLASQKHLDWLLKSWRLILDQGVTNARLWIVGDGESKAELVRLADDLKLADSCVFLGGQKHGAFYMGAADIVVMTSMCESFGNVILEAFVNGKPIVASRVDGIRDTLTDGRQGFLVPPADIELFARRLMELIRDPALRARMGEAGLQSARDYRAEDVVRKYETLFAGLLKGKDGPP